MEKKNKTTHTNTADKSGMSSYGFHIQFVVGTIISKRLTGITAREYS